MIMAFKLKGAQQQPDVEFSIEIGDGDLELRANGVVLGFIDGINGKLYLLHIHDEEDREKLPGISLSNGRLTIA
jgi:hypothetical protein